MTEFQSLACDFSTHNEPQKSAIQTIEILKKEYTGLSDWKIEEIKE